nr:DUF2514 family protein [Cupriavidus basilensis]
MLSRAGKRAGLLAEYADAARIVGQACECVYDSLTAYQSPPKGGRCGAPYILQTRAGGGWGGDRRKQSRTAAGGALGALCYGLSCLARTSDSTR